MDMFMGSYALLWLIVLIQAAVIFFLARELSELRYRAETGALASRTLPAGIRVPEFTALELDSAELFDLATLAGRCRLLLVLSSDCSVCKRLGRELAHKTEAELEGLAICCEGTQRGCQNYLGGLAGRIPLLRNENLQAPEILSLGGLPAAILIDQDWNVVATRYPTTTADVMASLVESRTAAKAPQSVLTPVVPSITRVAGAL